MKRMKTTWFMVVICAGLSTVRAAEEAGPFLVEIRRSGQGYELMRNGQPVFINGAGGRSHLEALKEAGGNSIRTWDSSREALDRAHEYGLSVCMGIRMQKPRHGADYRDKTMLEEQRERIRHTVLELKDHPALLMWGIGNEVEHHADDDDCILVWKEIETLAGMIKELDPNHPVITVLAGTGAKLEDIRQLCPSLDALGINSYGKLAAVPSDIERYGWDRPYIITEFGPRGWWEVDTTAWGIPLEDTSTEKARFYSKGYLAAISDQPKCLGSYVFLWGNKQEKTHTWFNLFLEDGSPTEIVDTMTRLWTGQWPDNRAPMIGKKKIHSRAGGDLIYSPSDQVAFAVQAEDPDGDALTIAWDLRRDESDNPSTGGDWERRIAPIEGAIVTSEDDNVVVRMPAESGNYRLFVYVRDPSGKVATANLPVRVESGR